MAHSGQIHGLRRIWKSAIPRDTSAWKKLFDAAPDNTVVQVAVILKSGAWISGELYEFDADPDPHPHRAIVLTQPQYKPSDSDDAAPLEGVDWIVIEAGDIEQLQAAFVEVEELEDTVEDGDG